MEKEMCGQYCCKNKYYCISKRNYLDDYAYCMSKDIDMTLSGTYLYKYPFKKIKKYHIDKYPSIKEQQYLINNIRNKFSFYDTKYSIIIGAGSNGLIQNFCKILIKNGDNILIPYLSFGQAEFAANSFGAETRRVYLENFNINLEYFEKSLDKNTKIIYMCNPNNPTGNMLNNEDIFKFAKNYPSIYIIIDESNIEYSDRKSLIEGNILPNLIILKSFSKAYGLANLRIGYAVCNNDIFKENIKHITINEFSGISVYCANKCILSDNYKKNVKKINKEILFLRDELKNMGIEVLNTNTNTLFTKTIFKKELIKKLEEHNISLVPIIDQDDNLHFRIACQNHNINKKFIKELLKIDNVKKFII